MYFTYKWLYINTSLASMDNRKPFEELLKIRYILALHWFPVTEDERLSFPPDAPY